MNLLVNKEDGYGIVSVIVSIMLFALILMAAAPVLVTSITATARNVAIANASHYINQQFDQARLARTTCETFQTFLAQPIADYSDGRGNTYVVTATPDTWTDQQVAACNDVQPQKSYVYTVTVTRAGDNEVIASASTLLAVPGIG